MYLQRILVFDLKIQCMSKITVNSSWDKKKSWKQIIIKTAVDIFGKRKQDVDKINVVIDTTID